MPSLYRSTLAVAFATGIALATAGSAFAQPTGPAPPTMPPPRPCEKPGHRPTPSPAAPRRPAAGANRSTGTRAMRAYPDCLKAFATEQQAVAAPHIRAANAAVEEYNKSTKTYNDFVEALAK